MTVNVAAGSILSIATAPSSGVLTTLTPVIGDYLAMTFTPIGEVEDAGSVGDAAADITFESLADARVRHFAGPFDAGTERVVCGRFANDAGQDAVIAGLASRLLFAFKLELKDRPSLDFTNTVFYYGARILTAANNVGNARNVVRFEMSLGINTAVTTVDPHMITP
jgi:hypothetical protein